MLGGGTPVSGSNPAGIGGSISFVGADTYAGWSGQVTPVNSTPVTAFKFTTPSNMAYKTRIAFGLNSDTLAGGETVGYEVKQNGEIIFERNTHPNSQSDVYFDDTTLILAAEAEIEIIAQTTDASGIPVTICLTMEPIK